MDTGPGLGQLCAVVGGGERIVLRWLSNNALGTWLLTRRHGEPVGEDELGNRYYRRRTPAGERRWVVYAASGEIEPSAVPPGWNAWLHHNADRPPSEQPFPVQRWEKPHVPNLTGSPAAHVPAGHERRGGQRAPATGDYEAWRPE